MLSAPRGKKIHVVFALALQNPILNPRFVIFCVYTQTGPKKVKVRRHQPQSEEACWTGLSESDRVQLHGSSVALDLKFASAEEKHARTCAAHPEFHK
jgi:hypothetical protein